MIKKEADDFRGLLYNPTLESEVVMLFSLLIPHLPDNFAIEETKKLIDAGFEYVCTHNETMLFRKRK